MTHLDHDWYPAPLPENVRIGARSWVYSSFAFLHCRSCHAIRIGHDSGLYNGTFLNLGPNATVDIGNYCTLVGAIIDTDGPVTIGDYSFLAHEVVVADSAVAVPVYGGTEVRHSAGPRHSAEPAGPQDSARRSSGPLDAAEPAGPRSIRIGSNVWIGARATLIGPVSIGEGAIVGAAAVVVDDVPPYTIAAGNPARVVGWCGRR